MKIKVGILGATGTVGQRFIQLLDKHPLFEVTHLGASPRSAGLTYATAVNWKLSTDIPHAQRDLQVTLCDPMYFIGCTVIFSGLDSDVAGTIEEHFMKANFCNKRKKYIIQRCIFKCKESPHESHRPSLRSIG